MATMPSAEAEGLKAWLRDYLSRSIAAANRSPELAREVSATYTDMTAPVQDLEVEWVDLGDVRAQWTSVPEVDRSRVVVFAHGGGFSSGDAHGYRHLCGHLARAAGASVLNVDYGLAPANPFPVAVDQVGSAYRWLLGTGVDPAHVALAGNSAGAALALSVQHQLLAAGRPVPAAVVALSPFVDLTVSGATFDTLDPSGDPVVTRAGLLGRASTYLDGHDPTDPAASPFFAGLVGSAPLYMAAGGAELLLDDTLRLAEHARRDGVPHVVDVTPGMPHDFGTAAGRVPESSALLERVGAWLKLQW